MTDWVREKGRVRQQKKRKKNDVLSFNIDLLGREMGRKGQSCAHLNALQMLEVSRS